MTLQSHKLRDMMAKRFPLDMKGERKAKAEACIILRRHMDNASGAAKSALIKAHEEIFASIWSDKAFFEALIDAVDPAQTPLFATQCP